jgi:hypothetical protein
MSWWPFSGDDLSGDPALDAVGAALDALAAERQERGEEKPSLAEAVLALEQALAACPDLVDPPAAAPALVARGVPRATSVPADVRQAVERGLRDVSSAFQRDHRRRPRVNEVRHAFQTVLSAGREEILRPPYPDRVRLELAGEPAPP